MLNTHVYGSVTTFPAPLATFRGLTCWVFAKNNHIAFSYLPTGTARNLKEGCSNQELLEMPWNFVRKCEYGQVDRHTHHEA